VLKEEGFCGSERVLELGAGSLTKAQRYFPDLTTTDGSTESLWGKEHFSRAESLPFSDSQFDIVIAKDTLHHFQNTDMALREINRVLTQKGVFIVSEPYWSVLGRVIFRFIHPEKWQPNTRDLFNDSSDPIEANQAILLCLTKIPHSSMVLDSGFTLEIKEQTYGLSYLLSGGLNRRTILPFQILRNLFKLEARFPYILKVFNGLNTIAIFRKL